MIKGIGVDICDLRRLTSLDSLAKKILHEEELKIFCQKKNEKAKRELGFSTRNIMDTLRDTVSWLREKGRIKA